MSTKVKKAITLSREQDRRLQAIRRATGKAYSQLIQKAVEDYLRSQEIRLMEEQYARYYGNPENRKRDRDLADKMWSLSRESLLE